MSLEIKLDAFEGPMDLLLLLIEKNKVDIMDIPIALITDQYLEYVESLQETDPDLEILSDFLVMAAELLDIKARLLLPREEDENGEEGDPRTELVKRLIEYQEFRFLAKELGEKYGIAETPLYKDSTVPEEVLAFRPDIDYDALFSGVTLDDLSALFRLVMEKQVEKEDQQHGSFGRIRRETIKVSDKLTHIAALGKKKKRFSFRELLEGAASKADLVVTFLACLELIRIGQVEATQKETFGDIEFIWNDDREMAVSKEDITDYD